jgi:hypothetical protein
LIEKFKKERFFVNEFTNDERGLIGWKFERKFPNGTVNEEIMYTEEIIGMLFKYGRYLSEK